jgi:hypothetical protein
LIINVRKISENKKPMKQEQALRRLRRASDRFSIHFVAHPSQLIDYKGG